MNARTTLIQLRGDGHRIGRIRNEIITLFSRAQKPVTAQDIMAALNKKRISANKTTVYRELDFLKENHLIDELRLQSNVRHFESSDQHHHHHLVCDRCHTISAIDDMALEKRISALEEQVKQSQRFMIHRHALEFYGVCSQCH